MESPEGVNIYTKYFGSVEEIKYEDPNITYGYSSYYAKLITFLESLGY